MTAASDWRTGAACASFDPGPWDPAPTREGPRQRERCEQMALDVCNGRPAIGDRPAIPACPIKAACLARAMDYGIWGGTTEAMRRGTALKPVAEPPGPSCGDAIGTEAGMKRHGRRGETACPACRAASAKKHAERDDLARGDRIRARDYMAMQAKAAAAIVPDPEWVTSARLTLLELETQRASA